jgi:hypothetical protein
MLSDVRKNPVAPPPGVRYRDKRTGTLSAK